MTPAAARRLTPPAILALAAASLGLGVFLPVVEISNLVVFADSFSIAEAAWQLLAEGEYLLGAAIAAFSAAFPLGKIAAAGVLWRRLAAGRGADPRWIGRLEFMGRWSCADIVIVAVAIVATKRTGLAEATMEIGLWFFAASVLLTAAAVRRLRRDIAAAERG